MKKNESILDMFINITGYGRIAVMLAKERTKYLLPNLED